MPFILWRQFLTSLMIIFQLMVFPALVAEDTEDTIGEYRVPETTVKENMKNFERKATVADMNNTHRHLFNLTQYMFTMMIGLNFNQMSRRLIHVSSPEYSGLEGMPNGGQLLPYCNDNTAKYTKYISGIGGLASFIANIYSNIEMRNRAKELAESYAEKKDELLGPENTEFNQMTAEEKNQQLEALNALKALMGYQIKAVKRIADANLFATYATGTSTFMEAFSIVKNKLKCKAAWKLYKKKVASVVAQVTAFSSVLGGHLAALVTEAGASLGTSPAASTAAASCSKALPKVTTQDIAYQKDIITYDIKGRKYSIEAKKEEVKEQKENVKEATEVVKQAGDPESVPKDFKKNFLKKIKEFLTKKIKSGFRKVSQIIKRDKASEKKDKGVEASVKACLESSNATAQAATAQKLKLTVKKRKTARNSTKQLFDGEECDHCCTPTEYIGEKEAQKALRNHYKSVNDGLNIDFKGKALKKAFGLIKNEVMKTVEISALGRLSKVISKKGAPDVKEGKNKAKRNQNKNKCHLPVALTGKTFRATFPDWVPDYSDIETSETSETSFLHSQENKDQLKKYFINTRLYTSHFYEQQLWFRYLDENMQMDPIRQTKKRILHTINTSKDIHQKMLKFHQEFDKIEEYYLMNSRHQQISMNKIFKSVVDFILPKLHANSKNLDLANQSPTKKWLESAGLPVGLMSVGSRFHLFAAHKLSSSDGRAKQNALFTTAGAVVTKVTRNAQKKLEQSRDVIDETIGKNYEPQNDPNAGGGKRDGSAALGFRSGNGALLYKGENNLCLNTIATEIGHCSEGDKPATPSLIGRMPRNAPEGIGQFFGIAAQVLGSFMTKGGIGKGGLLGANTSQEIGKSYNAMRDRTKELSDLMRELDEEAYGKKNLSGIPTFQESLDNFANQVFNGGAQMATGMSPSLGAQSSEGEDEEKKSFVYEGKKEGDGQSEAVSSGDGFSIDMDEESDFSFGADSGQNGEPAVTIDDFEIPLEAQLKSEASLFERVTQRLGKKYHLFFSKKESEKE